ncbi:MAG: hypothetical protein GY707_05280 [Desulfobacteraceae bacterium]|nr:hypothetical protein [Desulfobacteraceae bacterium]
MAISFNDVNGSAKTTKIDYFKFEDGDNEFRMVGGVLPRYVYWNKTPKNTAIAMECLGFDRDSEEFKNVEKDWHQHYFPDIKCKWSYVVQAFNKEGKLQVVSLRKQMFESILQNAAKHWGDPTDPDKGMKIVITKKKTGPQAFNVAYEVDVMSCVEQPLTDEQKTLLNDSPTIDELFVRQTSDEQKANIERIWFNEADKDDADLDDDMDDDINF